MKKLSNAPKKEVQSWLSLSQTASPNGKKLFIATKWHNFHSTFHSRHTMILPEACDFFACNHSCLQLFSCLFSFVTFFDVLISFFSIFCQQYFWSKITSRPSSLNFTSLATFVAKLLPTISIFTFCSDHCETSINAKPASENYLDRKSLIFNYLK